MPRLRPRGGGRFWSVCGEVLLRRFWIEGGVWTRMDGPTDERTESIGFELRASWEKRKYLITGINKTLFFFLKKKGVILFIWLSFNRFLHTLIGVK